MRLKIDRHAFKHLPLSLKILCAFLSVGFALTAASGLLYYGHARKVLIESVDNQVTLICERAERDFVMRHSSPIAHELRLMATSLQLTNYLMASREEACLDRVEVEKWFLHLLRDNKDCLSTSFLNASGQEEISVRGNIRSRTSRSLAEIAADGVVGRHLEALFTKLKGSGKQALAHGPVFRDAEGRLSFLAGMAIQEPEAGGFGGVIVQHINLDDYISETCQGKVLGAAVVWIYGSDGARLASGPVAAPEHDPMSFSAGREDSLAPGIHTAECRLPGSETPVMTVVCHVPHEIVRRRLYPVICSVVLTFSGLLLVTLLSSWLISRWISGPIRELTRTAESICVENLKIDLDDRLTKPRDEIGVLGTAFQRMVTNLRRSTTSIDNLNREIHERQKVDAALRERDERFRQVTENAGDLIWEVDAEGLYTYMSPIVEDMLGYKAEEIVGKKHFYDLFPTETRDEMKEAAFAAIGRQETFRGFVNQNVHKSGRLVILETNGTPILDDEGNLHGYRGVDRDITERRRAEQIQNELLKQLEDTNRELQDFAYIVSHDLKAPLRGITTLADWLATDYEDKLDDEGKSHLDLLKGRVERMRDLIDGILQYSRIGRVMDEIGPVDLAELVPSIVDALAPPAGITVTVADNLPVIEAERTKAVQVFQNLLSNAIKYMDKPEGHISIECVEADGHWKFSVADNGPGIDEKHFAKIFQMFQTLSPRDEYESTGVGLALVKKIVEMHGGSVWVESEPGVGSTFLFTWPTTLKGHTDAKLQTHTTC